MDKPVYEIPVSGLQSQLPPDLPPPAPQHAQSVPSAQSEPPAQPARHPQPEQSRRPRPLDYASAPPPEPQAAQYQTPPVYADPAPVYAEPALAPVSDQPVPAPASPAAAPSPSAPPVPTASMPTGPDERTGKVPDAKLLTALHEVVSVNASDLHVAAGAPPLLRVDGGLTVGSHTVAWDSEFVSQALRSILSPAQEQIFDRELEFDFAYTLSDSARFRVNLYQQRDAIGGAFRLIPTEIKQLDDLGVPGAVGHFATLPRGLVLVTGPTGSGKSTTLAALIDLVNRTRSDHIMTVEDPIEFLHGNHRSLVNQREVGNDTHSFGAALKHVLRQDPDVILIGELRDLETISVALTAAETGHLVFATLHTQDAPQTVDRVIDVFPPHQQGQVRAQLAATLRGVVCQTLVKSATGSGRVVATEIMVTTPAVANLIREGKTYQIPSAIQAGRGLGMQTMDQHLAELVDAGRITHQAAFEKVHDQEGFKRLVHRRDTGSHGQEFAPGFEAR